MFFSRKDAPNLAVAIPAMDHINQEFEAGIANEEFPRSIRTALALGKRTLDRYYAATDMSNVYRIAMSTYHRASSIACLQC